MQAYSHKSSPSFTVIVLLFLLWDVQEQKQQSEQGLWWQYVGIRLKLFFFVFATKGLNASSPRYKNKASSSLSCTPNLCEGMAPFKHSPSLLLLFMTCPLLLHTPEQKSAILLLPEAAQGYGILCTYCPECKAYFFDFFNKQIAHAFRFY